MAPVRFVAEAHMNWFGLLLAVGLTAATPALANDTMAGLGTGGLVFLTSQDVEMTSEDLYVSPDEVRVTYEFSNKGTTDQTALVAFPLPDITGSGDFMVNVPTEDPENIFGFTTSFAGEPVEAELHQYVFAFGIEYTDLLNELGVPLIPYGRGTIEALNALTEAQQTELVRLGLVIPMEYSTDGDTWQTDYTPIWTLRSAYSWEATFPAGETVTVEHRYKPSVGGTVAVTFLAPPYDDYDPATEYLRKYCTDDSFLDAVRRTLADPDQPYSAPFMETWLSYIWSTGANWSGPIKRFHLTIDKGRPENLVSFCWDGEVKKTSPTTFEMEATDFYPPWNRELEVLILNRQVTEG
jgi:hypothetical protein